MKKLVIAFILTLVLMLGMCAVVSAEADTTNDIPDTATQISFDSPCMGTLSETSATDWYKFTVPSSGKVNIKVTTSMRYTWYSVFSSDNLNSKLWGDDYTNGLGVELYLIAGDYYFSVGKNYDYGDYTLNISYTSADESFQEQIGVSNNNSFTAAQEIAFGADYKGQLAVNDTNDYYKFVISESGRINLKVTTAMAYTWYELYNASEAKVWGDDYTKGVDGYLHLTAGTYYIRVAKNYDYGNYSFKVNFESAKESFAENETTSNNSYEYASSITFGTEYKGQLAINDTNDYYKFVITESGRINLKVTTTMEYTWYELYNASEVKVWGDDYTKGVDAYLHLTAGTYYIRVAKNYNYGNYSFKVNFESAKESFTENETTTNNSYEYASSIAFGTDYRGQLAINDTNDYYKFVITESGRINLKVTTTMEYTWYELYNASEVKVWGDDYTNGVDAYLHLKAGTYYLRVAKNYNYGNYSFKVSFEPAGESFAENESTGNNSISDANAILLGTEYKGQIAVNDGIDYYAFTITTPQKITISTIASTAGRTSYGLYDSNAAHLWGGGYSGNLVVDTEVLQPGTYYFAVGYDNTHGNYSFKLLEQHDCNMNGSRETPPTCYDDGVLEKYCSVCGKVTATEPIAATHTWSDWVVDTPATCLSEGSQHRYCTVCNENETAPITMLEHVWGDSGNCTVCGNKKPSDSLDGCELVIGPSVSAVMILIAGAAAVVLKKKD
ncbi:MAG: hypothetical protein E7589_02690 [Ruminococcaceae bacterium]|nr:hypothetical protein [Oscillospiraceae bacterium]